MAKKLYSVEFQYLLQKKYYDGNWTEGSSILHALKVGKRFGFLPRELWTHTTEADRKLPYSQYIAKLQAIPQTEIDRLLTLCIDKIPGYTQLDVNNPMALAQGINESKAGILARFECGREWWTPQINPLRYPAISVSGHATIISKYDYTVSYWKKLANTWGSAWNLQGLADINWETYRATEAWVISVKEFFTNDLKLGMTHPDVKRLQKFLNDHHCTVAYVGAGSPGAETEYFGERTRQAVIKFQQLNGIQPAAGFCGPITRNKINQLI